MELDLTDDRKKLVAIAGGIALLTGVGGILIGRAFDEPAGAKAAAEAGEHAEEEEEHGREGFVAVASDNFEAIGIRTEQVAPGSLGSEILAQATATAPPQGKSALTARADGAITRIYKRLGDTVGAGETVALIESREAAAIMAERASAAARAQAANTALERERRLFEENVTARQDLEAAQSEAAQAQAELRRTEAAVRAAGVTSDGRHIAVRSLISGRITEMDAELGSFVSAGTELFEVANPRSVQIEAAVPWDDAQRIRPGDPAFIELGGGEILQAVVRSTTPSLDPESRAATVVLSPLGIPAGLTQGQAFRVRIMPRGADTAGRIVLPEGAVQSVEGRDVVFVQVRGGFQATPVTVGERGGGRIEILEGLKPGVKVATEGAFVLKSQLGASEAEH